VIRWTQTGRIVYDRVSTPFTWKDVYRVSKAPEAPSAIFNPKQYLALIRTAARCNRLIGEGSIVGILSIARDSAGDIIDSGFFGGLVEAIRRILSVRQAPEVEEFFTKAFPFPDPLLPYPENLTNPVEDSRELEDVMRELDSALRTIYQELEVYYGDKDD